MVARESRRGRSALVGVKVFAAAGAGDGARDGALGGAGMHFLLLQHSELGFQQTVFTPQLGNLRCGGESARDAVTLHDILETVEFLDAGLQVLFQGLVFLREVALDILDAALEADGYAFNISDCFEQVSLEGGEHVGDDGEGDYVAVD